jgi:hypothetical protein
LETKTSDPKIAEQGALHLNYHLKMMANLAALTSHYDANGPSVLKNATLEAMLVHARLLIEFVAGRPRSNPADRYRSSQDLQPKDFGLTNWDDIPNLNLDGYLYLADKYVAHLSMERFEAAASSRPSETVESGIAEARALTTRPTMDWPPELGN